MRHLAAFAIAATIMPCVVHAAMPVQLEPLLAADRAWSDAAKDRNLIDGLAAMFDREVVMVAGGSADLVRGPDAIRAKLGARPENATAKVSWQPVGGGISADGTHGYSYGALTMTPDGGAPVAQKYLAYWVKRTDGWRVLAYKRAGRREAGALKVAPPIVGTGRRIGDDALATLKQAEKAFSDEAQIIGLRAAFKKWGRPESINIGAEDAVAVGAEAIGKGVAGPGPGSPVTWAADEAVVAPSGDMGLTYGLLHAKNPPAGQPATIPFFTVWARPKPGDPWRYVAE
jgi:ketosteroid isomerase-like protein